MMIIFDFDGVIEDTFEFHRKGISSFAGISPEITEEMYRALHGENFHSASAAVPDLKNIDWSAYAERIVDYFATFEVDPKIRQILYELVQKGHDLCIVSSGSEDVIRRYLVANQMQDLFQDVLGMETDRSKVVKFKRLLDEYGLSVEDCLFCTDTSGDISEAEKVHLRTAAVNWGYHDREELEAAHPYTIISSFDELLPLVERLEAERKKEAESMERKYQLR